MDQHPDSIDQLVQHERPARQPPARAGRVKALSRSASHDLVRNRRASIRARCLAAMTHEIPTDSQPTRLTAAQRFRRNRLFARIRHQ
jgi:hypothetical protein